MKQSIKQLSGLLTLLLLIWRVPLKAQVAINTDASLPDASAMLDIKSTSKGLLIPRVTTALRTAFPYPADGLMVYDTDTKSFWYFQGVPAGSSCPTHPVHLPSPTPPRLTLLRLCSR